MVNPAAVYLSDKLRVENDDEKQAGEEEEEEQRDEEPLTLQLVDKYPMLPVIDSTTPLDTIKKILRAYVHAVRSAYPIDISPFII